MHRVRLRSAGYEMLPSIRVWDKQQTTRQCDVRVQCAGAERLWTEDGGSGRGGGGYEDEGMQGVWDVGCRMAKTETCACEETETRTRTRTRTRQGVGISGRTRTYYPKKPNNQPERGTTRYARTRTGTPARSERRQRKGKRKTDGVSRAGERGQAKAKRAM